MADSVFKIIKKPIFWVLLLALTLRLPGIFYGFPLFLVKDEPTLIYGALKMLELKTLLPAFHQEEFKKVLYYPPAPSYFYLAALSPFVGFHYLLSGAPPIAVYKDILAMDPSFLWVIGRVLNMLLGLLNILVVYLLARKLFASERVGILAALFLAVSLYHLQLSQVIRHWLPAALLIYLVWYLAARIGKGGASFKTYLGAGTLLGLAAGGVNTASAVAAIPLAFSHFFQPSAVSFRGKLADRRLAVSFLAAVLVAIALVALYPYGFTRAEGAPGPTADIIQRFAALSHKNFDGFLNFLGFYLKLLWRYEMMLLAAALWGAVLLLAKRDWQWVLAGAVYSLVYFALLYLFFNPIPRGLIFVLPLLAVFAGYAADQLWQKLRNLARPRPSRGEAGEIKKLSPHTTRFLISILISIFFFGWPLLGDLRYDWLLLQKDTRLVAREWVLANVPEKTKILVDSQYLRFINTKEGIRALEAIDPSALRIADYAFLRTPEERYPRPAHHILNLHFVSETLTERHITDPKFFKNQGFSYFIVEYDYADRRDISEQARALIKNAKLVQRFDNETAVNFQAALDAGGEIATATLSDLFVVGRLGKFVEIYEF